MLKQEFEEESKHESYTREERCCLTVAIRLTCLEGLPPKACLCSMATELAIEQFCAWNQKTYIHRRLVLFQVARVSSKKRPACDLQR